MKFLAHRIEDKRIQRMVKRFLKAGVSEDGSVTVRDEGTPQGGVISPLLANIYLHYALDFDGDVFHVSRPPGATLDSYDGISVKDSLRCWQMKR